MATEMVQSSRIQLRSILTKQKTEATGLTKKGKRKSLASMGESQAWSWGRDMLKKRMRGPVCEIPRIGKGVRTLSRQDKH